MRTMMMIATMMLGAGAVADGTAFALAEPFQDGMIVAKNKTIRVFGKGAGDIEVSLVGRKAKAHATASGWLAELPPLPAGGPYELVIRHDAAETVIHDVYVGLVVLASGQSNMQFRLRECNSGEEIRQDDPLLRSFSLLRMEGGEPYSPQNGWVKATRENAVNWSAIGYLVGHELRQRTGEAVGIINCYQGASVIEAWLPKEVAMKPEYQLPAAELHGDHFNAIYEKWNKAGILYDLDIRMLAPYALSHVMWYQGESNTGRGDSRLYPRLAVELVKSWRAAFQDEQLLFSMVQIADFAPRSDGDWKALQEGQLTIPSLVSGVAVVKSADVCEKDAIHPPSKAALSHRLVETILAR